MFSLIFLTTKRPRKHWDSDVNKSAEIQPNNRIAKGNLLFARNKFSGRFKLPGLISAPVNGNKKVHIKQYNRPIENVQKQKRTKKFKAN